MPTMVFSAATSAGKFFDWSAPAVLAFIHACMGQSGWPFEPHAIAGAAPSLAAFAVAASTVAAVAASSAGATLASVALGEPASMAAELDAGALGVKAVAGALDAASTDVAVLPGHAA